MSLYSSEQNKLFQTPMGVVRSRFELTAEATEAPCSVCRGIRNALSVLFQAELLELKLGKGPMLPLPLFAQKYPHLIADIREQLQQCGLGQPVCLKCQEDLFRPGTRYHGS